MSSKVKVKNNAVVNFIDDAEKCGLTFGTQGTGGKSMTISGNLIATGPDGFTTDTLSIAGGSITDTTGAISFGDENLTTTGTMTSAQFNMNSDKNLKKDIQKLTDDFDNILKLNPVNFKWKEHFSKNTNTQV